MSATPLQILWYQEMKNIKSCTAPTLLFMMQNHQAIYNNISKRLEGGI